jgi:hypothetical protein
VLRHRVYSSIASEVSVLPCDIIAAACRRCIPTLLRDVIAAARRRPCLPAPLHSVCLVASYLADGCLATLRCATPAAQPNSWLTCHSILMFCRNMLPPSSGLKSKPSKQQAECCPCCPLGSQSDPEMSTVYSSDMLADFYQTKPWHVPPSL